MATLYNWNTLKEFIYKVLKHVGMSDVDANLASEVLIAADLRGIDSHGIARLSGYLRLWQKERANMQPNIQITYETASTAVLNADKALGLISAPRAMNIAIEKAEKCGTGWVAVKNSNHFGIAGFHAMMALKHDMIGISMTNASPLVAPTFSKDRMLGTNPIAVAIPTNTQPPFVMDMATTTAANGKLEILQRKNENTPDGWVQKKDGDISNNPYEVQQGGALLPLGSDPDHGSHKGYCLGSVVDILSAVLSGANYGPWAPPFVAFLDPPSDPVGEGIGHFVGALRIDAFRSADEFKNHMDNWINRFRSAKNIEGKPDVIIPGDPERNSEQRRKKEGIPLLPTVIEDLRKISTEYHIPFFD